jgi:hypothetical protein
MRLSWFKVKQLGPESITLEIEDTGNGSELRLVPNLSRDNLLRLGYYANNLVPSFAMEAIVGNCRFI